MKTASNSKPLARCSVSRWTPPSAPWSKRARSHFTHSSTVLEPSSNSSASLQSRRRSACRPSSRSQTPAGTGPASPASPAKPRHETIRQRQDFRRRAIVLLQPDDGCIREASLHPEQPFRRGARKTVDRLVVVADRAELVPVAEPELEQRVLEQVDVLVLVDGERAVALPQGGQRPLVCLVHPHRELEEVLEVDETGVGLAPL